MECNLLKEPEKKLEAFKKVTSKESKISEKYTGIFTLRTFADDDAIKYLQEAFAYVSDSVLLKHEIAYALGKLAITGAFTQLRASSEERLS
jgi:predicted oxidoreductase (fatty acid repression mutant protein)